MYIGLLHTHNLLRWLILLTIVIALIFAFTGWFGKKEWTKKDNLVGLLLTIFIDLQLLTGLLLYFVSPLIKSALADFGAAMKNSDLRFFAMEHVLLMLIALILVHIGRSKSKKALLPVVKHKAAAIWFGVAFILILAGVPWERAFF
ncbi:MAG TPA: hypothetical protein VFD91_16575 [Mariniphaga sp.]|nr:hypothetical protein [Mariniphaga sp.]